MFFTTDKYFLCSTTCFFYAVASELGLSLKRINSATPIIIFYSNIIMLPPKYGIQSIVCAILESYIKNMYFLKVLAPS